MSDDFNLFDDLGSEVLNNEKLTSLLKDIDEKTQKSNVGNVNSKGDNSSLLEMVASAMGPESMKSNNTATDISKQQRGPKGPRKYKKKKTDAPKENEPRKKRHYTHHKKTKKMLREEAQYRRRYMEQYGTLPETAEDVLNYNPASGTSDMGTSSVGSGSLQNMLQGLDPSLEYNDTPTKKGPGRPRKKRKYTKHKKDPNAVKKTRKVGRPRKYKKRQPKSRSSSVESSSMSLSAGVSVERSNQSQVASDTSASGFGFMNSVSVPTSLAVRSGSKIVRHINLPTSLAGTMEFTTKEPEDNYRNNLMEMYEMRERRRRMISNEPERPQPLDSDGTPMDMVKGTEYLAERRKMHKRVNLSEELLSKKKDEDAGIERDDEDPNEPQFEDLLDEFDIDPEDDSLDLSLNDRRKLLLENMDDKQLSQYELFRRSNLNTGNIRRLVNGMIGQNVNMSLAKIIGGVGKMLVGEIVERAKDMQRKKFEAQVIEQMNYKRDLKRYEDVVNSKKKAGESTENVTKPESPPDYYEDLRYESGLPFRNPYTYNNFRVIIPSESTPLTPDDIREAWRMHKLEANNEFTGRWRQQGGGTGLMFR